MEQIIATQHGTRTNDGMGSDTGIVANLHIGLDKAVGTDRDTTAKHGIWVNDGGRVDANRQLGKTMLIKPLCQQRIHGVWGVTKYRLKGHTAMACLELGPDIGLQYHCSRLGFSQFRL